MKGTAIAYTISEIRIVFNAVSEWFPSPVYFPIIIKMRVRTEIKEPAMIILKYFSITGIHKDTMDASGFESAMSRFDLRCFHLRTHRGILLVDFSENEEFVP